MGSIDDRVVRLNFDNKQFESATAASMSTLDKLKQSLASPLAAKGMNEVASTIGKMDLSPLSTQVEGVSAKFLALATIGVTTLSRITDAAISAGTSIVKSLTVDPLATGWHDYETQINAVQTIMANTGLAGSKGLKIVEATLADLNEYANLTIYDFSQMTQNIGRFTAAGVKIKPATDAIKGMANVAALTGASTEQLGMAYYQMSQALATGTIKLMDWNSLANANMGTENMKQALMATAKTLGDHGAAMDKAIKKNGNFRDSLQAGWLTADVFTKTMSVMAGTLDKTTGKYRAFSVAELKAKGYTEAQAKSLQKLSQAAIESAINIRTYSQMIEAVQEGVATAWGAVYKTIFGNIFDATKFFTGLYNVLYDFFTKPIYDFNVFLGQFKKLGGIKSVMDGIANSFAAIGSWIKPLKDAWSAIFPPSSAKAMADTAKTFANFTKALILSPETINSLTNVFKGFFSILSIGQQIVSGVFGFIRNLIGLFSAGQPGASGILAFASNVGQVITNFAAWLKQSGAITKFFDDLLIRIKPAVEWIKQFAATIGDQLSKLPAIFQQWAGSAKTAVDQMSPMEKIANTISTAWTKLGQLMQTLGDWLSSLAQSILGSFQSTGDGVKGVFDKVSSWLANLNWVNVFKGIVAGGLVAVMATFFKAVWSIINMFSSIASIANGMAQVMQNLAGVLQSYQNNLRAKSLMAIAGAILMLAVAIKILSTIDVGKLAVSVGALYVMFKMLNDAMDSIVKMNAKGINFVAVAAGLVLIGGAMILFATAIKLLSMMDYESLVKGMVSLGLILRMLSVSVQEMGKSQGDMLRTGAGLMFLAVGVDLLAIAVMAFGHMDYKTLAVGIGSVVLLVGGLSAAMRLMPSKGKLIEGAAAIALMAAAINMLIPPIYILGRMDFGTLVKGIGALAVVLTILTVAMQFVGSPGTFAGAAAMVLMAVALGMLTAVISVLGNMDIKTIVIGIVAIVAVMAAIGIAAMALSEAIPFIAAFGLAIMLLGAGLALFGIGALAFATALSIVVGLATLGLPVLADAINNIIDIIPLFMKGLLVAIVEFNNTLIAAMPSIIQVIETFITSFLQLINDMTPKIMTTVGILLTAFLAFIVTYIPAIVVAGMKLINGLLKGIAANLPDIIKNGTAVIVAWIKGIGAAALQIATAAGDTLIKFMAGITKWINDNTQLIQDTTKDLGKAIVQGIIAGIVGMIQGPIDAIGGLVTSVIDRAKQLLDSHSPSKVFIKIGKDVALGFGIGLKAGKDNVVQNMNTIIQEIKDASTAAADEVKKQQDKLNKLKAKPHTKANDAAIKAAEAALKAAEANKKRIDAAYKTVTKEHKDQIVQLEQLAGQYDVVKGKLDDATKQLEDAKKVRDDFAKNITDKYSALPTIDATTSLDDYFNAIRQATADNVKFKATLEELRKIGLDDTSYKKFLDVGVTAQPFLDQLLAAGQSQVIELNNVDKSLADSASDLGTSAAKALYQAGVDAAQGLVDGLTAQMKTITDKMNAIGKAIADEIKRELGIHSPSKVLAEVGKNTALGLAKGLDDNAKVIDISAKRVGKLAVDSLKESVAGMSDAMTGDMDMTPKIAPVLDLDQFRKDANKIGDILAPTPLQASVTAQNADAANSALEASKAATDASTALQATGTTVELVQNNYSPKALSSAEIYRQTKNQISVLRER